MGETTPPTEWKTFRGEIMFYVQIFKRGLGTVGRKANEFGKERELVGQKLDM